MWEFTYFFEALSPDPINHFGIIVLLKQRNYLRLPLRRQSSDSGNIEVIWVLMREPHVCDAREILVSQDRQGWLEPLDKHVVSP